MIANKFKTMNKVEKPIQQEANSKEWANRGWESISPGYFREIFRNDILRTKNFIIMVCTLVFIIKLKTQ